MQGCEMTWAPSHPYVGFILQLRVHKRVSSMRFKRGDRNHKGHTFLPNHGSKINTTGACPHLKSKNKKRIKAPRSVTHTSCPDIARTGPQSTVGGGGDGRGDGNAKDS